ncbi:hypothetical protein C2L65_25320 [Paraburkholderia terrae]|uniref:Uncharacterized protein n=1 Tax=Paraburkholderia terrae TaxID=311230 RepID=A0A2I8ETF8_9BURK|nr:hypothetical protein C2L65_25320 [Paraburkholderia terrae]
MCACFISQSAFLAREADFSFWSAWIVFGMWLYKLLGYPRTSAIRSARLLPWELLVAAHPSRTGVAQSEHVRGLFTGRMPLKVNCC